MSNYSLSLVGLFLLGGTLFSSSISGTTLRIVGSTTVNPPVAEAAEILRERIGFSITVDTAGGSTGGIRAVGEGRATIGMTSKALVAADRERFPMVDFQEHLIGEDAISMVVSRDVWEAGVRALSAEQMRAIYEGQVRNWRELGGPNRRIVFYNKEPGRGTWEVFVVWLYGSTEAAPRANHPEVGANAEVRAKVSGTRGALSIVSTPWADGERVFALAVRGEDGEEVAPGGRESYPLSRPLYLLTDGPPRGAALALVDFLRSEEGRELVEKHGFVVRVRERS